MKYVIKLNISTIECSIKIKKKPGAYQRQIEKFAFRKDNRDKFL